MQLILTGINHQSAPVAIREKAAINAERIQDSLMALRTYLSQGLILSTCNRTEIYAVDKTEHDTGQAAMEFFRNYLGINGEDRKYVYQSHGEAVAQHLFRVAGGLESMVIGEYEVLGQVGKALESAETAGMVQLPLRHAFQSAIRTGRRIREETGISRSPVSVSSIAVDLAAKVTGDLKKVQLLVIGTGEAGQIVAKVARERGVPRIVISSKKIERATAVARALHGIPADVHSLPQELISADIIVTCSGAPHWVLDVQRVGEAVKARSKPLVIIDISVPRNVQPKVAQLENVFLYNIDHLQEISNMNRQQREIDVEQAEKIVAEELNTFLARWQLWEATPTISALMDRAEQIRSTQLNKTLKKLPPLTAEQQSSLESMTKSIVARILQEPIEYLKANGDDDHFRLVRELFRLDGEEHS